jgi:uncharacterized protein (TIGR03083 family)
MASTQQHDYRELMWEEVTDLGALLHELDDADFDRPSLCDGWRVRDVIGHMSVGHTTPGLQLTRQLAGYRFNIEKGSFAESKLFADRYSAAELRDLWDRELVQARSRKGIAKVVRNHEGFVDHLVHHQDIRRPLGRTRIVPEHRLVAALDALAKLHTPMFSTKKKVKGLRLVATDIDWSGGDGPTVEGSGEALVMAAAGRHVALDELTGPGLPTLIERAKAS